MRQLSIASILLATTTLAQVRTDRPVILTGAPGDRRVEELTGGTGSEDGISAAQLQAGAYRFTQALGTDAITAQFSPAITAPTAGLNLMVKIAATNTGPVTITVDGNGPYVVLKGGSLDLEAGDLQPGMVASLVFDGTVFHVINARRLGRRDCPAGFTQVNELYCIEPAAHDTLYMDDAALLCGNMNARLCTWGEWYRACAQSGTLGLANMGNQWEWTNGSANGPGSARVVGATSCTHAGTGPAFDTMPRKFRCCYDR
jgi:hypothetical protein